MFGALLEACESSPTTPTVTTTLGASVGPGGLVALAGAARAEGALNVIALPKDLFNNGAIISEFQQMYGITVSSAAPGDSPAQELASLEALRGRHGRPDAVNVSPSIAAVGAAGRQFAPYKVASWDTIPSNMKDPTGLWTGDYYGVISFGVNTSVVKNSPLDWSDLLRSEFKGRVSIDGDPTNFGGALAAVFGAALANGGSLDDITPGIEFFAELKSKGNWNPAQCLPANISKGTTPIAIQWDYLNTSYNKRFLGRPAIDTVIPKSGKLGEFYCQAISAEAPHPASARLWEEWLFSDEGQLAYLAGYVHPARFVSLTLQGKVPDDLAAELPPSTAYTGIVFPSAAQLKKAAVDVAAGWESAMG